MELGLALANPDPDGPPVSSYAWPGEYTVTTQDPEAGATIAASEAIRITISDAGGDRTAVPRAGFPPPPHLEETVDPSRESRE